MEESMQAWRPLLLTLDGRCGQLFYYNNLFKQVTGSREHFADVGKQDGRVAF